MKPTSSSPEKNSQSIHNLLEEYSESHQNTTNKLIHYFCVPLIFWSFSAILWTVKLPYVMNLAIIATIMTSVYYLSKDLLIASQMIFFTVLCLGFNWFLEANVLPLLMISIVVFVLAWIAQFIGHKIEGKKPSLFKDLQFLLIGPAWIVKQLFSK